MDVLVNAGKVREDERELVLDSIKQREQTMSTGIGFGIAIPHASSDKVEDVVAAFGRSTKGIEFDSLDGQPVFFVVLFVVPKDDQFQTHLRTLAAIAKFLNDKSVREVEQSARRCADSPCFREPFATQLMATPREILTQRLKFALEKSFPDTLPEVVPATDPRFGDYQTNVAMVLARKNRVSPREIARQIVSDLDVRDISEAPEIEGAGFINFRLTAGFLARGMRRSLRDQRLGAGTGSKPEQLSSISVPRMWRSRCTLATFGARFSGIVWLAWPAFWAPRHHRQSCR